MSRPSWDEYFINLCKAVAQRATCDRGRTACIIVKDRRVLCTGYVGSPPGLAHCDEAGHMMRKVLDEKGDVSQHCVRTLHAEQNAIIQAARYGIPIAGSTMYTLMAPCFTCAKMIVGAGIEKIVCERKYHADQDSMELFKQAHVKVVVIKDENVEYPNQKVK
ncbi:MAG: cytidine/deoxycytidylate deaminase family protein [Candidatus Bathyarchaeota archaeon]|nr:cytidine/deoxycytidylate deaminase family protein [Candidatus Bathyarchaeota archaeon]